jgi:hypothetical protein
VGVRVILNTGVGIAGVTTVGIAVAFEDGAQLGRKNETSSMKIMKFESLSLVIITS